MRRAREGETKDTGFLGRSIGYVAVAIVAALTGCTPCVPGLSGVIQEGAPCEFALGDCAATAWLSDVRPGATPMILVRLRNTTDQPVWWRGLPGCVFRAWVEEPRTDDGRTWEQPFFMQHGLSDLAEPLDPARNAEWRLEPGEERTVDVPLFDGDQRPCRPLVRWSFATRLALPSVQPPSDTWDFQEQTIVWTWSAAAGLTASP